MRFLFLSFLTICSTSLFSQTKQYSGSWTKVNTSYVFDFDLTLNINKSNHVEGYFIWKLIQYDENNELSKAYYKDKIGLTAKEYVRGVYNPAKGEYFLKGYKKEDVHAIIGIDTYKLKVDKNGDLGGDTNSNGSWLGRINGKLHILEYL